MSNNQTGVKSRKKPADSISFVIRERPRKTRATADDLLMAMKALRAKDPNSILALVAQWKIHSIHMAERFKGLDTRVHQQIDKLPEEVIKAICISDIATICLECSNQLESLLERRGHKEEI